MTPTPRLHSLAPGPLSRRAGETSTASTPGPPLGPTADLTFYLEGCSDPAGQVAVQGVLGAAERGGTGSGATRRRREAPTGVHLGALLDPGAPGPGKVRLNTLRPIKPAARIGAITAPDRLQLRLQFQKACVVTSVVADI